MLLKSCVDLFLDEYLGSRTQNYSSTGVITMFMVDVTHVKYLNHHNLEIGFSNGFVGVVNIDEIVSNYDGVFQPLSDPTYFSQVRLETDIGSICWPNGADLCPDVLYAFASNQADKINIQ
jgi:hypothetical protein